MNKKSFVLDFSQIGKGDVGVAGGKGANLGEMYQAGFPVPGGFVVLSSAYYHFLDRTSLKQKILSETKNLDVSNSDDLSRTSRNIRNAILGAKMPPEVEKEIKFYYHKLSGNRDRRVAVRSSATAEDLPDASFAGQQETYLNVSGWKDVVKSVQKCWASLFEARAVFYRQDKGFDHLKVGMAVPVQLMVESEVSGIMFTVNPLTNNKNQISIEAGYGLGQTIVSGQVTPDQYLIAKDDLKIVEKIISKQTWKLTKKGKTKVAKSLSEKQKLADKLVQKLAGIGRDIEKHYGKPQDIEWALMKGKLYIVQSRPVTTLYKEGEKDKFYIEDSEDTPILEGTAASPGASSGKVRILSSAKQVGRIKSGDVLVAEMTNPDYVPAMRKAVAVVTDEGGNTSHAAIVSRELGIPCVVGTNLATKILKEREVISVDGSSGRIYKGPLEGKKLKKIKSYTQYGNVKTATKVYVNLAEPFLAPQLAAKNVDGVGLLRAEFMIAQIGTHPRFFIDKKREGEFIQKLAEGIESIASAFYPRPVVYRATDFRTNEYRNLKGGSQYETEEANPMIGFRGAARYVANKEVFDLELASIKYVRNTKGFKNLHLMIPFVRTVNELLECKKIISLSGLRRSPSFKLWMMVEVPATAILLDDFIDVGIDGVSIGTNDLTQFILATDRDNERISHIFNERDKAVMWAIERVVRTAKRRGITSSVCGQAPSNYPDLVRKLVEWGVTSVSVSSDVIDSTRGIVYKAEENLIKKKVPSV